MSEFFCPAIWPSVRIPYLNGGLYAFVSVSKFLKVGMTFIYVIGAVNIQRSIQKVSSAKSGIILRNSKQMKANFRHHLTTEATATLIAAFVFSRLDYCNSLLYGCTSTCITGSRESRATLLASFYNFQRLNTFLLISLHCTGCVSVQEYSTKSHPSVSNVSIQPPLTT